jgi:hypothetical protein
VRRRVSVGGRRTRRLGPVFFASDVVVAAPAQSIYDAKPHYSAVPIELGSLYWSTTINGLTAFDPNLRCVDQDRRQTRLNLTGVDLTA